MASFIFKRLAHLIPTLLGISLLVFLLIRVIPGDPVLLLLGERGGDPQIYREMQQQLGLDKPITYQYWSFLKKALQGDMGESIISKRPVTEEFFDRFPATLELGLCALLLAICLGLPIGTIAAIKRNSVLDYTLMGGSLLGYSMPVFWWGLILIIIFSVQLGWTPVSGRIAVLYDVQSSSGFLLLDTLLDRELIKEEGFAPFFNALKHLILPTVVLGTVPLAAIARMTRSAMLEVLGEDYIRTARAKGLPTFKIIVRHALQNALIPIITVVGLMGGTLITGAILTETIFSWPGIGKWLVTSINARDYPVVQGGVFFIALMVVSLNIFVDTLYSLVNPKMKVP